MSLTGPVMRLLRVSLLVVTASLLGGCYVLQATGGQLALMARRRPLEAIVADAGTPEVLRRRLLEAQSARTFAVRELQLPDNGSYRQYADLGRDFAVWNVFATPPLSVQPRRWCFPVAGCVVYRGYFSERRARSYAARLQRRGDDVAVGGAIAYSTLGHFADPIVSPMLRWSDAQLAGTLFHELAHQRLYVSGDSAFNEAFASVVEEAGVTRWLTQAGRLRELEAWREQRRRTEEFSALLLETRQQLEALYASPLAPDVMDHRKHQLLGRLKFRYAELRERWGGYSGYDAWFDRRLGNADLVSAATYRSCMPGFRQLLAASGEDLAEFYRRAEALAAEPMAARQRALCSGVATNVLSRHPEGGGTP